MLQKNHKLHKATLSLKYVHQPKKGEMYQLVIHGLPDGVEEGVVKLIVGDVLDMDDEDDFDLVINDDSSGVITFANDYPAKGKLHEMYVLNSRFFCYFRTSDDEGNNF